MKKKKVISNKTMQSGNIEPAGGTEIPSIDFINDLSTDLSFLDDLPPLEIPEYPEICFAETCTCSKCMKKRERKKKYIRIRI